VAGGALSQGLPTLAWLCPALPPHLRQECLYGGEQAAVWEPCCAGGGEESGWEREEGTGVGREVS